MAGTIKGITIEFRGDTTQHDSALRTVNNETRKLDKELRQVDKALKFNPTSVELWRQKQQLLTQKLNETKDKLALLKKAQAEMDAKGVDKNSEEYRKLQREIIETESKVKTFEGQLKKIGNVNLRAASESMKQLGTNLTTAGEKMRGLSTAAAAVVASIGALTVKSGKWADDLNTMSKRYSVGTKDLQMYSAAADLVDVSTEAIAKSQTKLKKNMLGAMDGTNDQAQYFKDLGIEITNADGSLRDANDVFADTVSALGKMENETERDAIAMALMGKSANELNPLIEDGGETYKRVADTLAKYNLDFIDQETLDQANNFNDQLDTMKTIGLVALQSIGAELAGVFAPALEKAVEYVGRFAEWLGNLDPKILAVIAAVAGVVAVLAPVLMVLGKLAFAVSSIMSLMATIGPAIAAIAGPVGIVIAVVAAVVTAFVLWKKHGDKIKKFFVDFGKRIADTWEKIKEAISNAVEGIKTTITTAFDAIKTFITNVIKAYVTIVRVQFLLIKTVITTVVNAIKLVITTVFNAIKTFISTTLLSIKTNVTTVFNAIKTATTTAWNGIKNAIMTPINAAKNTVSTAVAAIKSKVNFSGIAGKVRSAFNSVKDAITGPIQSAKDKVQGIIDRIKGLFPLKIGKLFSGLKLPHFSLNWSSKSFGKLGSISYPTGLNVNWYKKAMENPYMFSSPTLFGAGEAGDEILYGKNSLMRDITNAVSAANGGGDIIININGANADPREIAEEVKRVLIQETNRRRLAWQ